MTGGALRGSYGYYCWSPKGGQAGRVVKSVNLGLTSWRVAAGPEWSGHGAGGQWGASACRSDSPGYAAFPVPHHKYSLFCYITIILIIISFLLFIFLLFIYIYSETPHEQPPHEQPPLLWGHIFRHHYIFLTSHLNVNPWWTATPLTWSEASDFGSSHPWRAATQQLLEVASHGIHGWFGCGLTDIHVNHTSGQPWVHRPKACKGVDHT